MAETDNIALPPKADVTLAGCAVITGNERLVAALPANARQVSEEVSGKIRELTRRCHNLAPELIGKLNQVIQGTARYFATRWSTVRWRFRDRRSHG